MTQPHPQHPDPRPRGLTDVDAAPAIGDICLLAGGFWAVANLQNLIFQDVFGTREAFALDQCWPLVASESTR